MIGAVVIDGCESIGNRSHLVGELISGKIGSKCV
jgi:hypothetical protein